MLEGCETCEEWKERLVCRLILSSSKGATKGVDGCQRAGETLLRSSYVNELRRRCSSTDKQLQATNGAIGALKQIKVSLRDCATRRNCQGH
jgi:hypothetical protein